MAETRTTIDSLIELLKSKGKVELGAISVNLGVDPKIVEGWAKVLEKGALVKISYEVGKMFIAPATLTPEQESAVKAKLEAKNVSVSADISSQLMSIEKLSATIENIKASTVNAEKVYAEQMPAIHKTVAEINKVYDSIEERNKRIAQINKKAEDLYDQINKRITELNSRIDYIDSAFANRGFDDVKTMVSQVTKDTNNIDSQLSSMAKAANDSVDQIRKGVESQTRAIQTNVEKEHRELMGRIREYSRQMDELEKQLRERATNIKGSLAEINNFNKEKERLKRQLSETRVEFNNSYARTSEEMKKSTMAVESVSKDLLAKIDSLKQGFGEATSIYDSISSVSKQMDEIQKGAELTKQELLKMSEQLKAMSLMTNVSLEQKTSIMAEMEAKSKAKSSKISSLKKKTEKAQEEARKMAPKEPDAAASNAKG